MKEQRPDRIEKKNKLRRLRQCDDAIKILDDELIRLANIPHLTDWVNDEYLTVKEELHKAKQTYWKEYMKTLNAINDIDDLYSRNILTLKYINGKNWVQIAEHLNYSEQHIFKLHNVALDQLIL